MADQVPVDAKSYDKSRISTPAAFSAEAAQRVVLRRRRADDLDALFRIFSQPNCQMGMVVEPFRTKAELQAWIDGMGEENFQVVATLDDDPIGFGALFPGTANRSHTGWISLFVHDDYQRRGIGSLLLETLMITADRLLELQRTELIVGCFNTSAISLYQRAGFVVEGRHTAFARREAQSIDTYTMARLQSPPTSVYETSSSQVGNS